MKSFAKFGRLFAILLCLQFFGLMTAEAAHSHHFEVLHPAQCQLCAVAHVPLHATPAQLPKRVLGGLLPYEAGDAQPGASSVVLTTCIRPPPAAL